VLLTVFLPGALALAQTGVPPTTNAPAENAFLQAVTAAPDPSSTIAAYTRGVAAAVGAVELDQAYVRRMFELGAPELADSQAHDLISRNAADATIRGIAAYNDAIRGKAHDAIYNLKIALLYRADEPFLLRTAGQFVAWNDAHPADGPTLGKDDVAGIEWLRSAGKGRQEFTDAYRITSQARQRAQAQAQAETASAITAPESTARSTTQRSSFDTGSSASYKSAASSSLYDYPSSGYTSGYSSSGYGYQYPYSYSSYGSGGCYPYSYGYGSYSYGAGSIIALSDRDFQRARASIDGRGGVPKDGLGPPPINPSKATGALPQPPGGPPRAPGAAAPQMPPQMRRPPQMPPQMPRPPGPPPRPPIP
jgi:hypothetical protein